MIGLEGRGILHEVHRAPSTQNFRVHDEGNIDLVHDGLGERLGRSCEEPQAEEESMVLLGQLVEPQIPD
jgi:hypothetical protein